MMPGLNRKGPENQGPMTGRAQGFCAGRDSAFESGLGRRAGRGRCRVGSGQGMRGFGQRGFGPGRQAAFAGSYGYGNRFDLKSDLEQRASELENELNAVREELSSLSK